MRRSIPIILVAYSLLFAAGSQDPHKLRITERNKNTFTDQIKNSKALTGEHHMKRVTGIGGIFFKSDDPKKLYDWYERHLGIKGEPESGAMFHWRDAEDSTKKGMTIWSIFPASTKYFNPSRSSFMVNYRVENLDELLKVLREEGVEIDPKREDNDQYGRFAWIMDPDGNRIELWEPPKEK